MPIDERELRRVQGIGGIITTDRRCTRCSYNLKGIDANARCPECGTPITPVESRRVGVETITIDRLCGHCHYNLKGLPVSGQCPECGTAYSRTGRRRFIDSLADAPLFYLKTLALGASLLAVCSCFGWWAFMKLDAQRDLTSAALAAVAALGWATGVFITTGRRQVLESTLPDAVLDSPRLRFAIRASHVGWVLAVVFWLLALRSGPPVNRIAWQIAILMQTIGSLGIIPLAILLSCLSDWAGDTGLGDRFRISAWGLSIGGLIVGAAKLWVGFAGSPSATSVAGGLLVLNSIWATLAITAAGVLFLVCLAQLAYITTWAIFNSAAAAESSRRILEMRKRHEREMADRTRTAGMLAGDNPGYKRNLPKKSGRPPQ